MSDMNIAISNDLVEPIIRDKISAAIVAELGDPAALIETMVSRTLAQKVDHKGNVSKYRSDNTFSLIEALAKNALREVTAQAIAEFVEEQKPKIKEEMAKQLKRQSNKLAKIFVDGLVESTQSSWKMVCNVSFNTPSEG